MWCGSDIRVGSFDLVHSCSHQLHGDPKLPAETEACASVTSAFLQVMRGAFLRSSKSCNLSVQEPVSWEALTCYVACRSCPSFLRWKALGCGTHAMSCR